MMLLPIASSSGRARSISAASPPTMIASEPSTARFTPPDTGASIRAMPFAASSSARRRVSIGADELMSMTSAPGCSASAAPLLPSSASRTIAPLGSMVMTTDVPAAASLARVEELAAALGEGRSRRRREIGAAHRKTGSQQPRRHRQAHHAEADEGDRSCALAVASVKCPFP